MTITCPNGHTRKFYVTYTSVGAVVERAQSGEQEYRRLDLPAGSLNIYHCADCGCTVVIEHDTNGNVVEGTTHGADTPH